MEFFYDLLLQFFIYLPLMSGAYISILILRFPDLTMEASWSIGAIVACIVASHFGFLPPLVAPFFGAFAGILCGCLTGGLFVITGRAKLLAGLISYYLLVAVGFHLLGESAAIYLNHDIYSFGFADSGYISLLLYGLLSSAVFVSVIMWQKTSVGIKSRIIGENAAASTFYRISLDRYFVLGLVLSNAIIGFGGGLYGIYYATASNAQGIGLVIKAFLALLIGNELLKLLRFSKRTVPYSIVVGSLIFVFLALVSERLQLEVASRVEKLWFKPTDKQFIVSIALILILWFRRGKTRREGKVSQW